MYETHKREPVLDTLRKLSDIFDVSIDYLLEVKEHKNNETFGNRLKQKRKQFGYTQEDVAKKIGVQRVAYNRYESDTHEPNFDTFKKICKLFAVTSDYLLGIDDED